MPLFYTLVSHIHNPMALSESCASDAPFLYLTEPHTQPYDFERILEVNEFALFFAHEFEF